MDLGLLLNPPSLTVVKDTIGNAKSVDTRRPDFARNAEATQRLRQLRARLGFAAYRVTCTKGNALAALEHAMQLELTDRTRGHSKSSDTRRRVHRPYPSPDHARHARRTSQSPAPSADALPARVPATVPRHITPLSPNLAVHTDTDTSMSDHGPPIDSETGAELLMFVKYARTTTADKPIHTHLPDSATAPLTPASSNHAALPPQPAAAVNGSAVRAVFPTPAVSIDTAVANHPASLPWCDLSRTPPSDLQSPWPTPASSPNFSAVACTLPGLPSLDHDMKKHALPPSAETPLSPDLRITPPSPITSSLATASPAGLLLGTSSDFATLAMA